MSPPRAFDREGQRVASARGRSMAWGIQEVRVGQPAWGEGGGALFLPCLLEPAALGRGRCWQLSHRLRGRLCPKSKARMASTPGTRGVLEGHCRASLRRVPSEMSTTDSQPKADRGLSPLHPLFLCYPGRCPSGRESWFLASKSSIFLGTLPAGSGQCLLQADPARVPSAQVGEQCLLFLLGRNLNTLFHRARDLALPSPKFPVEVPHSGTMYTAETQTNNLVYGKAKDIKPKSK